MDKLKLLILGAHPDDAEFHAGGLMCAYAAAGHSVRAISVTNGAAGHHFRDPEELSERRRRELAAAADVIGGQSQVWEHPDGGLLPGLDVRAQVIREIRQYEPDLVLTHRLCDYHPDHRAVGQVVQDASYMVTVPLVEPDTPSLRRDPVVAYMPDLFTKPNPLAPHVVLDTTPYIDTIVRMLACHESQVFEWLPYNHGRDCPEDPNERLRWLQDWYCERATKRADRFRRALIAQYGDSGKDIAFAEAYEVSEYAAAVDDAAHQRLFGFLYG